jgi:hypothetical protein
MRYRGRIVTLFAMGAQQAGLCKVWLCSPGGHHTLARLGGDLEMTAPTWWWWWSAGRLLCTRARASWTLCFSTEASFGCYKGVPSNAIIAHGAHTAIAPAPFHRP